MVNFIFVERPIPEAERPFEILQQWGIHRDEVKFYLRHHPPGPPQVIDGIDLFNFHWINKKVDNTL